MTQQAICVAGAHRSGTSMLTRLLYAVGLHLGPDKDLMPAAADNPDGFWENLRFVRLNDEILNTAGAAWDLPPWDEETFQEERYSSLQAKAKLLIETFAAEPTWGWKDPRTCLTLPFWQTLLPGLKTVIIVRNPLEVAYSMHRRNGTSYALGLRLWEIYNRRLLAQTEPGHRIVTDYQTFFHRPAEELARIVRFTGLDAQGLEAAAAIVTTDRRHTSFTKEQLIDAGVATHVITLYDSLVAESAGGPQAIEKEAFAGGDRLAGSTHKLDLSIPVAETVRRELAWRRGTEKESQEKISQLQARIEALAGELAAHQTRNALEIGRRDGRITELQAAYAHLDTLLQREYTERGKLSSELERLRQESARQAQAASQREAALRQREAALRQEHSRELDLQTRAVEELEQLRERFQQTNRLLHEHSIQLTARETDAAGLSERLRQQLGETKRLVKFLEQTEEAASLLRDSRRWKMINPFAWVASLFGSHELRGFGHLDKNVAKYRAWRLAHPIEQLESAMAALRSTHYPSFQALPAAEVSAQSTARPAPKPPPPSQPLHFPSYDEVDVSVIIPVYNQLDYTLACLGSLQEHADHIPFEVIVIDDFSTDTTPATLSKVPGLVYRRSESNLGFIASCNLGARTARGRYLLFLNNDTVVTPGWLASLRDTFDFDEDAGLVGSKLVYPDGRLQEAGGIIWRDASGWNRGKFQDVNKPEFNFLREVDYCSAASVMIPRDLFHELGGFDSKYAPAYYEDTDLAFKVRASGRKVLYQPVSRIVHYEGISSGTDISAGAKRYQEINRKTFADTWKEALARQAENGDILAWDKPRPGQKRILVIDHHLPLPDRDSGSLRMFQILKILYRLGHRVTFLPDNLADIPPYGDDLRQHGIEVVHHPYINSIRGFLETQGARFDVVILSRCDFAQKHVADVRRWAPQSRLIFDTVDLHFLRSEREASLTRDPAIEEKARAQEQAELALVDQSDETWVVSDVEATLLRERRPQSRFNVVSNIVDVPGPSGPFTTRRDFLFIGSFQHTPNIDAVIWFVREIYPKVASHLGGAKFYIIGNKAPPDVIGLATENIVLTGLQRDVSLYFNSVKLSIAPLRFGAGVKGKINQSMAFGVPVVATTLAVEGMNLSHRKDVLIADSAEDFAASVIELYRSEDLWNTLSRNGTQIARARYSPEAAQAVLAGVFLDHAKTKGEAVRDLAAASS